MQVADSKQTRKLSTAGLELHEYSIRWTFKLSNKLCTVFSGESYNYFKIILEYPIALARAKGVVVVKYTVELLQ